MFGYGGAMLYFKHALGTDPHLKPYDVRGKSVMIVRWGEHPDMRMLISGRINAPVGVNKMYLSGGRAGYEVSIMVANAWQLLSPGDEVFIYDPQLLDSDERSRLMQAVSLMLTGGIDETEIDAAVASILDTYRNG